MIAAADIDILVLNKSEFENYAKQEMLKSFDSVPGFSNLNLSG
ncbi:hypothetical protein [Clostridium polyendosporum]|nr:hypothetical protein [Clostridium polyendosporum]